MILILDAHDTQWLLYHNDGKCGAWARFLIDILRTHGAENVSLIGVERVLTPIGSNTPSPLPTGSIDLINQAVTDFNNIPSVPDIPNTFLIVPAAKFLVKNWNVSPNNFYQILSDDPENYQTTIPPNENVALDGVDAQSKPNPYSVFHDHSLVKFNNKYYDPSYDTVPFDSFGEWEANSVAAFGAIIQHSTPTVSLLWVEKNNTAVATDVDLSEKTNIY